MDDWDLSAEDLDRLERDAFQQLAQRHLSSSSSSTPPIPIPLNNNKIDDLATTSRKLPESASKVSEGDGSKQQTKFPVKFFLHASGSIAAKFLYNQIMDVPCVFIIICRKNSQ